MTTPVGGAAMREPVDSRPAAESGDNALSVHWDDSNMRSIYSNVCNVTGTREEIMLLFGVHQAWQRGVKEVRVQLQERVILSAYGAKRLSLLLTRVIREYENRYGPLPIEAADQAGLSERLPTG
jgi:Protein of unknown function (DUF3467)